MASRATLGIDLMLPKLDLDLSPTLELLKAGIIPLEVPLSVDSTNDPNTDAGWDWTRDEPYDLFAATPFGSPTRFSNVRLPYFADEGPAADDFNNDAPGARDISPDEGWVLLYRDFGTPDRGAVPPRFILYNRYRGLLRLFYFNPYLAEAYTYGLVTLRKQTASEPFGLLTFTDGVNTSLADFDPEREEVAIGRLVPITWNYADFLVVGYEPNLPAGATLSFTIFGVRKSDVQLQGEVDLDAILEQGNPIARKTRSQQVIDFLGTLFKNAQELGKAIDSAFGESKDGGTKARLVSPDSQGRVQETLISIRDTAVGKVLVEAYTKALGPAPRSTIAALSPSTIVSIVSAGISLYRFLLSPGNERQAHGVGGLKGSSTAAIELTGSIVTPGLLGTFLLRVPGATHTSSSHRPLYDKPLGVFSVESVPHIDITIDRARTTCTTPGIPGFLAMRAPHTTHAGGHTLLRDRIADILGQWDPDRDFVPPPPVTTHDLELPTRYEHRLRRPKVVFNPEAGFDASVEVAYARPGGVIDLVTNAADEGYMPIDAIEPVVENVTQIADSCWVSPPLIKRNASLRVTVRAKDNPDLTPVTLVKLYPARSSVANPGDRTFPVMDELIYELQYVAL